MTEELTYGQKGLERIRQLTQNLPFDLKCLILFDIASKETTTIYCRKEEILPVICIAVKKEDSYPNYIQIEEESGIVTVAMRFTQGVIKTSSIYRFVNHTLLLDKNIEEFDEEEEDWE